MQTQSRLAVSGGSSSSSASEDKLEAAVIRELTRGHELTAQLRAAAMHALRGQGQAEATAAFILQEMSRAFTVCLSIISSPARAPPPTAPQQPPAAAAEMPAPPGLLLAPRRSRDDSIPREQRRTSSPHYDGYQWRKYGQKRITRTQFPRCYFKCSFHRERNCRATKKVQQCSGGDPPQYVVMYFNEHTCDTAAWTTEPAANSAGMPSLVNDLLLPGGGGLLARQAPLLDDERGAQEEHERRLLVSSLARVLGAQQQQQQQQQHQFERQSPAGSGTAAAVNVGHHEQEPPRTRDAPGETTPRSIDLDVDVTDYDVTDALCLADCYDLVLPVPDPDDGFRPF